MQSLQSRMIRQSISIYNSLDHKNDRSAGIRNGSSCKKWSNPDNIACGSLGKYFFILELYKQTQEAQFWDDLMAYTERMGEYGRSVKTNNYSLFYGRMGLCYFYLELFKTTQNTKFLEDCLHIAKDYLDPRAGRIKSFDRNGLADGTAGIMLFFTALHHETKEKWILDYIEQSLFMLTKNTRLTESEIYWPGQRGEENSYAGYLYGNEGIAFCFFELGKYFNNKYLSDLATAALGPGDEGSPSPYKKEWEKWNDRLNRLLSTEEQAQQPMDIFHGLAGWGLAFKEAFALTNNTDFLDTATQVAATLMDRLSRMDRLTREGEDASHETTFLFGSAGVGYFLMKMAQPDDSPSLLFPRIPTPKDPVTLDRLVTDELARTLEWHNNFQDTLDLLEKKFPAELDNFLKKVPFVCSPPFLQWIHNLYWEREEDVDVPQIQREKAFLDSKLLSKTCLRSAEEDILFAQKFDDLYRLPDDQFCRLNLAISKHIFIVRGEDTFDFSERFTPDSLSIFFKYYGYNSFVFHVNRFNNLEVANLGILRFSLDLFISSSPVGSRVSAVSDFIMSQDKEIIDLFMIQFKATDKAQLQRSLPPFCLDGIKELLSRGFLEVIDNCKN